MCDRRRSHICRYVKPGVLCGHCEPSGHFCAMTEQLWTSLDSRTLFCHEVYPHGHSVLSEILLSSSFCLMTPGWTSWGVQIHSEHQRAPSHEELQLQCHTAATTPIRSTLPQIPWRWESNLSLVSRTSCQCSVFKQLWGGFNHPTNSVPAFSLSSVYMCQNQIFEQPPNTPWTLLIPWKCKQLYCITIQPTHA